MKKLISVMTPCYNEEDNIEDLYSQVKTIFENKLSDYDYEHVFIDNCSKDRTVDILKMLARKDPKVKIIVNARNFGFVRSSYYGLIQPDGDAVIFLMADLQDPPSLIVDFVTKWEEGYKVVQGVRKNSRESFVLFKVKKLYYYVLSVISDVQLTRDTTGFGLYDKCVIQSLRKIDDPYPYFKGLISELGFGIAEVEYVSAARKRGVSSANFFMLYDFALLGITSHSRVPIRVATMSGFIMSVLSIFVAIAYLVAKLINPNFLPIGIASLHITIFFFAAVQLFFIGIIGEYIGLIHLRSLKRPLVVERERVNFD
ncbi:MAG: glycosyltransferase [Microcystis wesenbergii Mw_QC_S_20081001_S30D]|jgi:glycosyltransferase involved in cell wall biosynthesis|uniref:Glycosyltransferase n=1 Tax=Microcystis wesenbergii Mw_QC_S_20081001_S30D TaxID=2486245 RepID=A0A552JYR6_9CHRO|nr:MULTISPECIES: glycosyltransferase family 2 protein [unclassified Microcystis]MCA6385535.1 glycosyltransferase family 2 protein [Cytophagales bacterium]TRU98072.1 MAG: glycosyltransferase [Microcystis wesenbergii Mw_QC_S_20081001_S30]TRV00917.1 MAG: glycosyltransferase [Microcystis wesenbergii Mw_QC_S_20081001_S30D]MCA2673367.1 glycosyltransferase family 2 protein [Microcystis sp. M080S2]MCA2732998.1 glycosyltransferase family 2 protein [Microcystis sp. M158S2]